MSNLLILTPDIPSSATTHKSYTASTLSTPNETEDLPFYNTFRGYRYQRWDGGYSSSEHNGVYDLGPTQTKTSNFIVLSKLDYLVSLSPTTTVDYNLQNSSDDVTYTNVNTGTVPLLSLLGPYGTDYCGIFATSTAARYWRIRLVKSAGADFFHKIGKIYFGTYTDIGEDLEDYKIERIYDNEAIFTTESGVKHFAKTSNPKYRFQCTWTGITDANTKIFVDNVWAKRHTTPVFLYTQSYHDILDNQQLLHCKLLEATIENVNGKADYNTIQATFEEVLG